MHDIFQYLVFLGGLFVAQTLVLGGLYIFLRALLSGKGNKVTFSWWPIFLWAGVSFSLMLFATDISPLLCIPSIVTGVASGYILEKLTLQKRPVSQGASMKDYSTPPASSDTSSSSGDTADTISSDDTDFGGGTFSGGGGSSSW